MFPPFHQLLCEVVIRDGEGTFRVLRIPQSVVIDVVKALHTELAVSEFALQKTVRGLASVGTLSLIVLL